MRRSFRRFAIVAVLCASAPVAACAGENGNVARGRALADKNCGRCHATGATGASAVTDAPPFRDLHKRYPVEGLAEALAEGITVAHSGDVQMPEITFTPDQIDDFLAYLDTFESDTP